MVKSVKHGTTAFGAFSITQGGNLEQRLSHALEFGHFLLYFRQFCRSALFNLFTRGLRVHTQREELSNLFEGETKKFRTFQKANLFHRFFRVLPVARSPACRLLQQPFTLIKTNGFNTNARETRNLPN